VAGLGHELVEVTLDLTGGRIDRVQARDVAIVVEACESHAHPG
jgi:hypothetical protein